MTGRVKDIIGQKFGRWTVLSFAGINKDKVALWLCRCECGTERKKRGCELRAGDSLSCGCLVREKVSQRQRGQFGPNAQNWKGGKHVDSQGYVQALVSGEHRYIMEHRLVMERHLGRKLTARETVHHKNGNRADNRIENLDLYGSAHFKGQRLRDLVENALDLIAENSCLAQQIEIERWKARRSG